MAEESPWLREAQQRLQDAQRRTARIGNDDDIAGEAERSAAAFKRSGEAFKSMLHEFQNYKLRGLREATKEVEKLAQQVERLTSGLTGAQDALKGAAGTSANVSGVSKQSKEARAQIAAGGGAGGNGGNVTIDGEPRTPRQRMMRAAGVLGSFAAGAAVFGSANIYQSANGGGAVFSGAMALSRSGFGAQGAFQRGQSYLANSARSGYYANSAEMYGTMNQLVLDMNTSLGSRNGGVIRRGVDHLTTLLPELGGPGALGIQQNLLSPQVLNLQYAYGAVGGFPTSTSGQLRSIMQRAGTGIDQKTLRNILQEGRALPGSTLYHNVSSMVGHDPAAVQAVFAQARRDLGIEKIEGRTKSSFEASQSANVRDVAHMEEVLNMERAAAEMRKTTNQWLAQADGWLQQIAVNTGKLAANGLLSGVGSTVTSALAAYFGARGFGGVKSIAGAALRRAGGWLGGLAGGVAGAAGSIGGAAIADHALGLRDDGSLGFWGRMGRIGTMAGSGAAAGAGLGLLSGPFAPVTSTVGAIAGGIGGTLAGLGEWAFGDPPTTSSNIRTSKDASHVTGLNASFRSKLEAMFAANPRLTLVSGYRSVAHQQRLWQEALKKYGSPEKARKHVAPPGKSRHNFGLAADIGPRSEYDWLRRNAKRFGLHIPMGWEPWHVEPTGSRSGKEMVDMAQAGSPYSIVGKARESITEAAHSVGSTVSNAWSNFMGGGDEESSILGSIFSLVGGLLGGGGGGQGGSPSASGGSMRTAGTAAPVARSGSLSDLEKFLAGLRMHESNNNYTAQSKYSTASGAYQYIDGTWNNYGGYKRAKDAPPRIQDQRARSDISNYFAKYGNWEQVAAHHFYPAWADEPHKWNQKPSPNNPTVRQYVDAVLSKADIGDPPTGGVSGGSGPTIIHAGGGGGGNKSVTINVTLSGSPEDARQLARTVAGYLRDQDQYTVIGST